MLFLMQGTGFRCVAAFSQRRCCPKRSLIAFNVVNLDAPLPTGLFRGMPLCWSIWDSTARCCKAFSRPYSLKPKPVNSWFWVRRNPKERGSCLAFRVQDVRTQKESGSKRQTFRIRPQSSVNSAMPLLLLRSERQARNAIVRDKFSVVEDLIFHV